MIVSEVIVSEVMMSEVIVSEVIVSEVIVINDKGLANLIVINDDDCD